MKFRATKIYTESFEKIIYYVFALNEFNFRRISFSRHKTQVAAQAAAYKASGQKARAKRRDFNGAESAESDLHPMVIAGTEQFKNWAQESKYAIHWHYLTLDYQDVLTKDTRPVKPDPLEVQMKKKVKAKAPKKKAVKLKKSKPAKQAKKKAAKKKKGLTCINVKMSKATLSTLRARARKFTKGNVSALLRYAGLKYTLKKGESMYTLRKGKPIAFKA